jgi:predicted ABC-type sugar transport system permease subunit
MVTAVKTSVVTYNGLAVPEAILDGIILAFINQILIYVNTE